MALSADATYLATASDNAIAVWLLATLTPVFEVTVDYRVRDLAFSPTGRVLAAVHERLMQLWDLDRKMEIARMPIDIDWWGEDQPEQPWTRFLPAAGLISLNAEYRSRFWLWRPDDMIRSACTLLTVTPSTLARWKAVAGDAGDPATCGAHQ
jgi:WD40 repeat protein